VAREQRKLAAIVAADVVGYSRLMGRDESGTLARLKAHRSERLEPALARNGGRLVKSTGDGVLAEFGSAVDALTAAIEFQQSVAESNRNQPEDQRVVFRIGIHLGDLLVEGDDLYGDGVNVAARLEGETPPGGILISRAVREAVEGRLKAKLQALGELTLKNIERPIRAFRVVWDEADWQASGRGSAHKGNPSTAPAWALASDDKPSIAVLPFANLSGDPQQEYFVDGLVEDIIAALSRMPWYFVIARNSSFAYKGRFVDVRQVGSELGVRYVLEGSVRKAGNRLRISGQLIDTMTGNHIWADRYDGALEDVFDLQDSITSSVVAVITPKVVQAEIARAQAKPTNSLSAYDLYLRALALAFEDKPDSYNQALTLLYRVVELDPNYSSAYGLIANCYWNRLIQHMVPLGEERARGVEAARRAVEIGRDNPDALARGGLGIALLGERPEEGLPHLERALALSPNAHIVARYAAMGFVMVGDHAKALGLYERTLQLSPLDVWAGEAYFGIALLHFFAGRFEESISWADRALGEGRELGVSLAVRVAATAAADRPPEEVQAVFQRWLASPAPRPSIATIRQRMWGFRQIDVEAFVAALRKAGLPE